MIQLGIRKIKFSIFLISLTFNNLRVFSQNDNQDEILGISFLEMRDYPKAEIYLSKLFDKNSLKIYPNLYKTYLAQKKYKEALDITEKVLKIEKTNLGYLINKSNIYLLLKDSVQCLEVQNIALKYGLENLEKTTKLVELFRSNQYYQNQEKLISLYVQKSKDSFRFQDQYLEVKLALKKYDGAIDLIFQRMERDDVYYMNTLIMLQTYVDNHDLIRYLERKAYHKLSIAPNSDKWTQVALWVAMLTKDYEEAVRIAKSYDRRMNSQGNYMLYIADMARNENNYDIAIEGYMYIKDLNNSSTVQIGYDREISTWYQKIQDLPKRDTSSINTLKELISKYYVRFGQNFNTAEIQLLHAEFLMKYCDKIKESMQILTSLSSHINLPKHLRAKSLLLLGDYKLIDGDIWDASLIYGKVDKDEKDSPLGEEARYRNSKIFYYNGDFELAADLLSILKTSTSELLSNDALHLSVFIQDHLEDDSLNRAMREIARSELLFIQNEDVKGLNILANIKSNFSKSSLQDDILKLEGEYYLKKLNFNKAAECYKELFVKYPESILADRAIYEYAKIQEGKLGNKDEAKEAYLKLLTKYKDSVFSSDARKRLRILRGENFDDV